jgi:DNA polymerase-3 subunit gamma/tau
MDRTFGWGRIVAAEVWYRKWRPQTFADTVGQRHVTDTLARAVALGRVAHAYLFCGPRGTGKTTTARLLAKAVNCQNNAEGQPCGVCASCVAVAEGRALDLIEMDAASNRGIDEIRALREKVGYSPAESRYKVYIIDEVHELTSFAFDALLKTLEEPPPHVIFVLATTEAHRVPETILSRCQRFDFTRIKLADVVGRLRQICDAEGVTADDAALTLIARRTGGALRDAVNVLEQTVASQGQALTEEGVRAAMGGRGDARAAELAGLLTARDLAGALTLIAVVRDDGVEPRRFAADLVETLRNVMLVQAGASAMLDLAENEVERLRALAGESSVAELLRVTKLVSAADFRADPQSPLPLELAVVEAIAAPPAALQPAAAETVSRPRPITATAAPAVPRAPTTPSVPPADRSAPSGASNARPVPVPAAAAPRRSAAVDRIKNLQTLGRDGPQPALGQEPAERPSGGAQPSLTQPLQEQRPEDDLTPPEVKPINVTADALPFEDGDGAAGMATETISLDETRRKLRAIYERCRQINRTAAAYLNSRCDIVEIGDGLITFGIENAVLAAKASEAANSSAIATAVGDILGAPYKVAFVARADVASRMELLADERPSHLLDEALKRGATPIA